MERGRTWRAAAGTAGGVAAPRRARARAGADSTGGSARVIGSASGGGYFDRTLATMVPRPLAIGVGFELGRVAAIRPLAHDIPLDVTVTEAGIVHHVR